VARHLKATTTALALAALAALPGSPDSHSQPVDLVAMQWQQYEAQMPKTILELQLFRTEQRTELKDAGQSGTATLTNLNPNIDAWVLLTLNWGERQLQYHLDSPDRRQHPELLSADTHALRIGNLAGGEPCILWEGEGASPLDAAAGSSSTPIARTPTCAAGALRFGTAVASWTRGVTPTTTSAFAAATVCHEVTCRPTRWP
jgi:hypothetical protein